MSVDTLSIEDLLAAVEAECVHASLPAPTVQAEDPTDPFDGLVAAERSASRYVDAEPLAHLALKDGPPGDVYLKAPWGAGKTYAYMDAIRKRHTAAPADTILIISARRTLSAQHAENLKGIATNYSSFTGNLDPKKRPVTIWQLESLVRVPSDVKPDLLVIDEAAQLFAHAYQNVERRHVNMGSALARLFKLVRETKQLLVTDNDLTSAMAATFQCERPTAPCRVLENVGKPWRGRPAVFGKQDDVLTKLVTFLEEQALAREDGSEWHGAAVCCHSRKFADGLAQQLRDKYGADSIALYTSETSDKTRREDCEGATQAWANKLAVIYTPTVTVGVSCDSTHLSRVFGFFQASGNQAAPQSAQMLFRARDAQRFDISVEGKANKLGPQNPAALYQFAVQAPNRGVIPDELRDDRNIAIVEPTSSDPKALHDLVANRGAGRAWVCARLEINRSAADFLGRIKGILNGAGLECRESKSVPDKSEVALLKEAIKEAASERADLMAANAAAADQEDWDPTNEASRDTKLGRAGLLTAKAFDVDPQAVTGEWIAFHEPLAERYARLKARLNKTEQEKVSFLATRSDKEASDLIVAGLCAAGLDPSSWHSDGALVDLVPSEELVKACENINAAAHRVFGDTHAARRAKKGLKKPVDISRTINAALYQHFGGRLEAEYIGQRKQARVRGYRLVWAWESPDAPALPEPKEDRPVL